MEVREADVAGVEHDVVNAVHMHEAGCRDVAGEDPFALNANWVPWRDKCGVYTCAREC